MHHWEAFQRQVVEQPWPGVARALIIAGADRRGAIYGTYDLSEQLGISPWHWFADVPIVQRASVSVSRQTHVDYPRVRYRGFFINDEGRALGMRGDVDEPMSQGTAISLLASVVSDQRRILEELTGKSASQTPQVWALYKEVHDYYDQGMTVPEDITLLFADDNWGQVRLLPPLGASRPGGYGVYYHFDYVGGPRNYKWLNSVQVQ